MIKMKCCSDLWKKLQKEGMYGIVHSSFDHAINIMVGEHFVTLVTGKELLPPNSIMLLQGDFKYLSPEVGDQFFLSKEFLENSDKERRLMIGEVAQWQAELPVWSGHDLAIGILQDELAGGSLDGLGALGLALDFQEDNQYVHFIRPRWQKLIQALLLNSKEDVLAAFEKIVGFGIGLTPSADDAVAGLMAGCLFLDKENSLYQELLVSMTRLAADQTTKVSEEQYYQLSQGRVASQYKACFDALNTGKETMVRKALRHALLTGHTSGSDFIAGMITAFTIDKEKKEGKNSHEC